MKNNMFLVGVILLLSGCATAYQKEGMTGGFNESQLDQNVWKVSFRGNGYTRKDKADDFVLLRCAELTLKNGYSYFGLIDSNSSADLSAYTTPSTSYTSGNAQVNGNSAYGYATTQRTGGNTFFVRKPSASNTVVMFKNKTESNGFVFDANFVCNSLGDKYKVRCGDLE